MMIQRLCSVVQGSEQTLLMRLYAAPLPSELPRAQAHKTAHFAALELLSSVLAEDWALPHCRIVRDENGKPALVHPELFVNLSHCRGLAVCGVAAMPVGVDAEPPREGKARVLSRICSPQERAFLSVSSEPQWDFSRLWTLKEAYGKCVGAGIRLPLAEIAFDCTGGTIRFAHEKQAAYGFFHCLLPEQYAIAVCLKDLPTDSRLVCHQADMLCYGSDLFSKGAVIYAEY